MKNLIIILFLLASTIGNSQIMLKPNRADHWAVAEVVPTLEALNFTNVSTGWHEEPAGYWSYYGTAAGRGVATKHLTGDGWIEVEVASTVNNSFFMGLFLMPH